MFIINRCFSFLGNELHIQFFPASFLNMLRKASAEIENKCFERAEKILTEAKDKYGENDLVLRSFHILKIKRFNHNKQFPTINTAKSDTVN